MNEYIATAYGSIGVQLNTFIKSPECIFTFLLIFLVLLVLAFYAESQMRRSKPIMQTKRRLAVLAIGSACALIGAGLVHAWCITLPLAATTVVTSLWYAFLTEEKPPKKKKWYKQSKQS